MNFIVSSSSLLHHLQAVSRVISSKNTMPILDNFLFQLSGNELTITASDLETTLITKVQLDPQRKLDLERNFINNTLSIEKSPSYKKYTSKFKIGLQHLLDFISFLS